MRRTEERNMQGFVWEILKWYDGLEQLGVDEKIILK
jgi:hypothetical protein